MNYNMCKAMDHDSLSNEMCLGLRVISIFMRERGKKGMNRPGNQSWQFDIPYNLGFSGRIYISLRDFHHVRLREGSQL